MSEEAILQGKPSAELSPINIKNAYVCRARSIPIDSTMSSVFRNPAVSATMTGIPPTSRLTSSTSLVVPGNGVTIAASRWATQIVVSSYSCRYWEGELTKVIQETTLASIRRTKYCQSDSGTQDLASPTIVEIGFDFGLELSNFLLGCEQDGQSTPPKCQPGTSSPVSQTPSSISSPSPKSIIASTIARMYVMRSRSSSYFRPMAP